MPLPKNRTMLTFDVTKTEKSAFVKEAKKMRAPSSRSGSQAPALRLILKGFMALSDNGKETFLAPIDNGKGK